MRKQAYLVGFGERAEMVKALQRTKGWSVSWSNSFESLIRAINRKHPEAITISFQKAWRSNLEMARQVHSHTDGRIPMLMIVDPAVTEEASFAELAVQANVDYALFQATPDEIAGRLQVLLLSHQNQHTRESRLSEGSGVTTFLYDPQSHRLNAREVATFFGFSLPQLSTLLKTSPHVVKRAPDASRLQPPLQVFERIARGLALVDGDKKKFSRWLNTPNSELGQQTPREVIASGKGEVVAGLVEDALLGQPA